MVSGPPSGQLVQVTLLRHWLFFFQNIFHIRGFRLPASDKKNKRGTKESWWYCYGAGWSGDQVSIVVARVGGDTSSPREQSQSANRRSALHLRSNHWQIACHTLHMAKHWMITGETENSEKCKISQDKYSGPPTKKLKAQITYFLQSQPQPIFQSVESPTKENPNRRIFWTYYLVIFSIFVLVIDDLDELVLWWSQGPHMIHVLKAHAWPRFPSVFDFLLPSVLQIGAFSPLVGSVQFQPWAFRRYVVPFIHLTAKSQLCIGDLLDPSPPSMQKRQNVSLATVQFHTFIFF